MIIPPPQDRYEFYLDLITKCEASLPDRRQACNQWRMYYLQGTLGNQHNVYQNRIRDKINLLSAFLYAQETTKFDIKFAAHVPPEQKLYSDTMREIILDLWHNTDTDRLFGEAVTWSLIDGARFKKVLWDRRSGVQTYTVEQQCLGVLREDVDSFDQEAICQTYWITRSELGRQLYNHPRRDEILSRVDGRKKDDSSTIPETVNRIIISQVSPNMIGSANVDGTGIRMDYLPRVEEELIEMRELWVWDDFLRDGEGDYRVYTCATPDITIFDRPNFFMPGEHPFIKVCAFPLPDYFWGFSVVSALIGLQDWRDKRLGQIDRIIEKQLRPSRIGIGTGALGEEKRLAMDSPGAYTPFPNPVGKIETYVPQLTQDPWNLISNIDEQMDEIVGLSKTLKGRGDEGVRAEGHAMFLGRMGAAPVKKLALLVEDGLEDEASLMLKVHGANSKTIYLADKAEGKREKFLLSQVSQDFRVRVAAHSASPVFAEENKALAVELFKAQAINKHTLVEMLDPPMLETILARLPELEAGAAQAAKVQAAVEQSKADKNAAQAQQARAKIIGLHK